MEATRATPRGTFESDGSKHTTDHLDPRPLCRSSASRYPWSAITLVIEILGGVDSVSGSPGRVTDEATFVDGSQPVGAALAVCCSTTFERLPNTSDMACGSRTDTGPAVGLRDRCSACPGRLQESGRVVPAHTLVASLELSVRLLVTAHRPDWELTFIAVA